MNAFDRALASVMPNIPPVQTGPLPVQQPVDRRDRLERIGLTTVQFVQKLGELERIAKKKAQRSATPAEVDLFAGNLPAVTALQPGVPRELDLPTLLAEEAALQKEVADRTPWLGGAGDAELQAKKAELDATKAKIAAQLDPSTQRGRLNLKVVQGRWGAVVEATEQLQSSRDGGRRGERRRSASRQRLNRERERLERLLLISEDVKLTQAIQAIDAAKAPIGEEMATLAEEVGWEWDDLDPAAHFVETTQSKRPLRRMFFSRLRRAGQFERYYELEAEYARLDAAQRVLSARQEQSFEERQTSDEEDVVRAERRALRRGEVAKPGYEDVAGQLQAYADAADGMAALMAEADALRRRYPVSPGVRPSEADFNRDQLSAGLDALRPRFAAAAVALEKANAPLLASEEKVNAYLGYERMDATGDIFKGGWDAFVDETILGGGASLTAARLALTGEVDSFAEARWIAAAQDESFAYINPGLDRGLRIGAMVARDMALYALIRGRLGPSQTSLGAGAKDVAAGVPVDFAAALAAGVDPYTAVALGGMLGAMPAPRRVRHFTSARNAEKIMKDGYIISSGRSPFGVHVGFAPFSKNLGKDRAGYSATEPHAGRHAAVEFDMPKQGVIESPSGYFEGSRKGGVIPEDIKTDMETGVVGGVSLRANARTGDRKVQDLNPTVIKEPTLEYWWRKIVGGRNSE